MYEVVFFCFFWSFVSECGEYLFGIMRKLDRWIDQWNSFLSGVFDCGECLFGITRESVYITLLVVNNRDRIKQRRGLCNQCLRAGHWEYKPRNEFTQVSKNPE